MASRLVTAALAATMLTSAPAVGAQAPPKGSGSIEISGPIRVVDGDTFEVYIGGRQVAIGLIGVKAIRANTPCGRKAAELMQELVNTRDGVEVPLGLRFEEDLAHTFDAR